MLQAQLRADSSLVGPTDWTFDVVITWAGATHFGPDPFLLSGAQLYVYKEVVHHK